MPSPLRISASIALSWFALVAVGSAQGPQMSRPRGSWGPPDMRAELDRTIFRVDVLDVELRFDEATARRIDAIARGSGDRDAKRDAIARAGFGAREVAATMRFERHVPLRRFVSAVRDDLEKAERAGMIDPELRAHVSANLPTWFAAIRERGFESGDRLLYWGDPSRLHTVLVGADGEVFVDQIDRGPGPKRALLGGYFAPGSAFRESLVDSAMRRR